VGSLRGEPGRSLKIRLSGHKAGVWHDFAAGVGGSDPISLAAALFGLSQSEAARRLADMLGVEQ
jgi:twinkle protein